MVRFAVIAVLGAAMLAAGCATTATGGGDSFAERVVGPYQLGGGDQLRIIVFDEETLSGEFFIDGTGVVSMPLIGEVEAMGKTVREFARDLEATLAGGYLNNPRVSVEVINYRPYYILGEVTTPGEYPYTDGLTVMNAVATAEGFTYRADERRVYIRSAGEREEREFLLSSETPVLPGDTLRIGERFF